MFDEGWGFEEFNYRNGTNKGLPVEYIGNVYMVGRTAQLYNA